MSAPEPKEQKENTTIGYSELEPQVKESQGGDQVSPVLPEEILLTPSTCRTCKAKNVIVI